MENKEKKSLEIKILGTQIKIATDEEEEYVYKIVSHLNKKLEEVSKAVKIASNTEKLILVALNVVDEYFKLKEEKEKTDNVERNFSSIISLIDEELREE